MADTEGHQLEVGAAAVDVTPEPGCFLAGFGQNRVATDAHDPLWARAIAIVTGEQRVVIVAVDCIGLQSPETRRIADSILPGRPDQVVVCATHTHSGPDTIGLWGPDEDTRGVAPAVLEQLVSGAIEAGQHALAARRPAELVCAACAAPPRTAVNLREPDVIDDQISILRAFDLTSGEPLATLVNWACHPETLQRHNHSLSSDFATALREVSEAGGGTTVYVNGALGAMVTTASAADTYAEAARIGTAVGDAVNLAVRTSHTRLTSGQLKLASQEVRLPLTCTKLKDAIEAGVLNGDTVDGDEVRTRVTALGLGPATFVTLPGEAQPAVGKYLKRAMRRPHRFLLGLANDELGYILRRADHDDPLYAYEATMSLGPDTARRLALVARQLIEQVED